MKRTTTTLITRMRPACLLALGAVLWLGCDEKKKPANPPAPAPPAPDVTPKAGGGAGAALGGATSGKSGGGGIASTSPSTTTTPDPKNATASKDPAVAPVPPAGEAEQSRQAQDLIGKAMQAIKDNRLDDAGTALDKVDAMKATLPKATQEQLKTVRANLDSVQKLQKTELPAAGTTDTDNK